jgi:eukaryotic-like serine/threonine-protein kinase
VPVLQRAIELDPDLAMAWTWLAVAYYKSGGNTERYHEYLDRAWALRDRVSARERLWIISTREGQTTGQFIQNFENWARIYRRDPMPQTFLGRIHQNLGDFEQALTNFQEVYRLYQLAFPPYAIQVVPLVMTYGQLDRFDEAKAAAEKMFAQGQDAPTLHHQLLAMAYAQGDQEAAAKHINWFSGKPEEYLSLGDQGADARVRGRLHRSRELLQRAAELALLRNLPDTAAGFLKPDAGGDALIGNCETAQKTGVMSDSSLDRVDQPVEVPANHTGDAMLALCGSTALAERAEELNKQWVSTVFKSPAQVPVTRAAVELGFGHTDKAIELLKSAAPYERAYPMSNYIRGLAYLRLRRGGDAAAEFQKILDHRGANWGPLYPLSYLGLARGAALEGDTARARGAYQNFFALWKDADPDVPILIQARKEYTALSRRVYGATSHTVRHSRNAGP